MQDTFSQRLAEVLKYFSLTPAELARLTSIKRQTIEYMISSGNPTYDSLLPILRHFDKVSARWLLLGEGEMIANNNVVSEPRADYMSVPGTMEKMWMEDRKELARLREINHNLMAEINSLRDDSKKKEVG